jgi:hypothetical protein
VVIDAGATYGVLKTAVIENWPRVASKHIKEDLNEVSAGNFDFSKLEPLLQATARTKSIAGTPEKRNRSRKASKSRA